MGAGVGDGGRWDPPWRQHQPGATGGAYQDLPTPPPSVRRQPGHPQGPGPWGDPSGWRSGSLPGPEDRPEPPDTIRRAVALMYSGAGLTVVSALLFFATTDQLGDVLADATGATESMVDGAVAEAQVRQVFQTALGVGLWIWMAIKNGEGRRWARVVATVFGVINTLVFALGFVLLEGVDGVDGVELGDLSAYLLPQLVLGVVVVVLGVVTLVQLHHPASAYYYDESERYHAAMTIRGYR